ILGLTLQSKFFLIVKKPQYITIIIAIAAVGLLWAFGRTKPHPQADAHEGHQHDHEDHATDVISSFSIDSALLSAKEKLPLSGITALNQLESAITTAPDSVQKLHAFHQLSGYWKDSIKAFVPYA